MEIRDWAMRVFTADCMSEKLLAPEGGFGALTDREPGKPIPWKSPSRPSGLQISPKGKRKKFPRPHSLHQPEMRMRCLHTFGNHELMALEMMAWALLAFPEAPASFRRGLAKILLDEQEHFQLYVNRIQGLGFQFGDLPINDHFWRVAEDIRNPLDWVCTMHLSFEQANLDHAPYYRDLFAEVEDPESSALMQQIFVDEIRHVQFGGYWLDQLAPDGQSTFQTFMEHLPPLQTPSRARGPNFQAEARKTAGLSDDFVEAIRNWNPSDKNPS